MFETSESTAKLDAQLAKAQGEIETAEKDTMNPHFGKTYADLASVWKACRAALSKYEISVTQWPIKTTPGRIELMTRVAHAGEWMRSTADMPVEKQTPHGVVASFTYLRRAMLGAVAGVAPDDDDDGNDQSLNSSKSKSSAPRTTGAAPRGNPPSQSQPPVGATGAKTPGGITLPNTPALNPDEYFVKGSKMIVGKRIDEVPIEKLELFKADAEKHFSEAGVDPETSTTDVARSYRTVRAILKTYAAKPPGPKSAFDSAPSGPITPKDGGA